MVAVGVRERCVPLGSIFLSFGALALYSLIERKPETDYDLFDYNNKNIMASNS